jgi:hypothetical protein
LREHTKELIEAETMAAQQAQQQGQEQMQREDQLVERTFQDKQAGRDASLMEAMLKQNEGGVQ